MVVAASRGDVLLSTSEGVFLEHGGHAVQVLARSALPLDGVSFLTQLADGTLAAASKSAVILARPGGKDGRGSGRFAAGAQLPGTRIEVLYPDREGSLWVGTNHGLARIGNGAVQLLPPTDPLAANAVVSLLEDREGDLWAGTETAGLHILRDSHFRVIGLSEGLTSDNTTAIVEDAKNTVWIGTRDGGLNRIPGGGRDVSPQSLTSAGGLLSNVILSLAAARNGDLWVGTPDGLNHVHQGRITSYTSADGLPDDFIRSLLVAPDDSLWIGTRRGLTHLELSARGEAHFQSFTQADGLGSDLVGALARTPDGDLWIATLNGLTRLHQGHLRNYTTADGLSSNVVTALDVTADGMVWIGTQGDGLNLWDGRRFTPIREQEAASPGPMQLAAALPAAIHAILHDDFGHLWLASGFGLVRAESAALVECGEHGKCGFASTHFTTADGLRSRETSNNSHPTACRTSLGELWFATPRGVVVTDPRHFGPTLLPPVEIERFAVDDQDQDAAAEPSRIGAGHLRFQFDYAGLSFASPQKLRYQYMLEGFDHVWTDAGTRRTAYYTNIPPGHYRFRLRANLGDKAGDNSGGVPEADLAFELLPHFYQTVWFVVLLILLGAGVVFLVFRRRVLRVEREFRAVMAERNRIAREIHDTLAQGYVGISVQLEVMGELLRHNRGEAAAKHLKLTQGYVREGLDDARKSIWALRSQDAGEQTLPVRLRRLVEKANGRSLAASLEVHGAYRALSPDAEKELLRIGQEAIHNVEKHAMASRMSVRLEYDERLLALTVTDDGKGFQVERGKSAAEGHYGLTGMRERASLIHARIEIASKPGEGTTVRIEISAPPARARSASGTQETTFGASQREATPGPDPDEADDSIRQ
jgi:signal transduction histidine kinase/ligand-binding sensor domain-containing protein